MKLKKTTEVVDHVAVFQLERALVTVIADLAKNKGLKQAELARRAFPQLAAAPTAWTQTRGISSKTGKPQRLKFADVVAFSQVLGYDIPNLISRAELLIESGWTCPLDPDQIR